MSQTKADFGNPVAIHGLANLNEANVKAKYKKLTLGQVESFLLKSADILRKTGMDANEYKEYLFGMLFLKRLSDQFEEDMTSLQAKLAAEGKSPKQVAAMLRNKAGFAFWVPDRARWELGEPVTLDNGQQFRGLLHVKQNAGEMVNKALAAIEEENIKSLAGVLKPINFMATKGDKKRLVDDDIILELLSHFSTVQLANHHFEFPDLLGAGYEYLIKYFADTAGKKGGEFYTPSPVVRLLVQLMEPIQGMSIGDPTCGSGGMLVQSGGFVEESGGDPRLLGLYGQEVNPTTWAICKMNMILHGYRAADIRNGDTLKNPMHLTESGELLKVDRVIANFPFSMNYKRSEMKFQERFHTFMPETGKKADMMFIQHIQATLAAEGKAAVVAPHGVLFRGSKEKEARERIIRAGHLEAVIGLPPGLFYGTGIPACILVINKKGANKRKEVLFINADREYKEGKNQNSLRPEDIEKIAYVYHEKLEVPAYSRVVTTDELEKSGFDLNIRRYVDNSPPPEPQDVRAHIHGGVPTAEINSLGHHWDNYPSLKRKLFKSRAGKTPYMDFSPELADKADIKRQVESDNSAKEAHGRFHDELAAWWKKNVKDLKALPDTGSYFPLKRKFADSLEKALVPMGLLDKFQVRGAFAEFSSSLAADFKSVAASGWNAELIPEEEILKSQFPEVLAEMEAAQARIAELEGLFEAAKGEEGDEEVEVDLDELDPELEVLPKAAVDAIKAQKKELNAQLKLVKKSDPAEAKRLAEEIEALDARMARHTELEAELKTAKQTVKAIEKKRDDLVDAAREKISDEEAKELILARWMSTLMDSYESRLQQMLAGLVGRVESLWEKYAVTLEQIEAERDAAAKKMAAFLKELGYE